MLRESSKPSFEIVKPVLKDASPALQDLCDLLYDPAFETRYDSLLPADEEPLNMQSLRDELPRWLDGGDNQRTLEEALSVWAQVNGKRVFGDNALRNSGIVHYFGYRGVAGKENRFYEARSIGDFTAVSFGIQEGIVNPMLRSADVPEEYSQAHEVDAWVDLADEAGNMKRYVLKAGHLYVSYQAAGDTQPRIITMIPGYDELKLIEKVKSEQKGATLRSNRLARNVQVTNFQSIGNINS